MHLMVMTVAENNISFRPEKLDWKFVLILCLHLLAVGAMYGSITSQVSSTEKTVTKIENKLDLVKNSIDETRLDVASLKEVKGRLDRIESSMYQYKPNKP